MKKEQFEEITKWQKETFSESTALSKLAHLQEEILELRDELLLDVKDLKVEMEFADCFILLFGCASSYGLSYDDICHVIKAKMEINKNRKWGKPNSQGVVNHIKTNQ